MRSRIRSVHALPPDVLVRRERDVGEDAVVLEHLHRVRIRVVVGPRRDAEESELRVHRVEPTVVADAHPGDVVADGPQLPALELGRRYQHREVGLAGRARERAGDEVRLALGTLGLEQHHVLREPALVLRSIARDPQREALLSEQRVSAVSGSDRPDGVVLREVRDVAALRIAVGDRVKSAVEVVRTREPVERDLAHPGHDPHVQDDVDRVRELDAEHRERRIRRAHEVGDDVHRSSLHRAVVDRRELAARFLGLHPVVRRARLGLRRRAHERQLLGPGDVVRVRARVVGAWALVGIQRDEHAAGDRLFGEELRLLVGTVAPIDLVGLAHARHLVHPGQEMLVGRGSFLGDEHRESDSRLRGATT